MKILLGVPEYPPYNIGGGGLVYEALANHYRDLGHDVTVLYGFYPTKSIFDRTKSYTDKKIKFHQIPLIPYPKKMPFLRGIMPPNLAGFIKMVRVVIKQRPDVVHLHGYGQVFVNMLAIFLKLLKIPYLLTFHGYSDTQNSAGKVVKISWNIYDKLFNSFTIRGARRITCISKFICDDKRNIGKSKSVVINNGFDFSIYDNIKTEIDIKKKHNLPQNATTILSIGRISKMKGFQLVVEKLPELIKNGLNPYYFIMGDDDGYKDELENLIKEEKVQDRVIFLGFMGPKDKKVYLEQCDIFAAVSLWEPFGLMVLEAMYFGKHIWSSEVGGIGELLADYKYKTVIDKIPRIDKREYKYDMSKYKWDNIAKEYIKLLQEIS